MVSSLILERAPRAVSRRRLVVAAAAAFAVLAWTTSASAHSFLVTTNPAQGQRLTTPPSEVVLRFSEEVELRSVKVTVTTVTGGHGDTGGDANAGAPELAAGGLEVAVPVIDGDRGVHVVAWEAFSAVDGHGSSGEFAFAVGDVGGAIPSARSTDPTSVRGVLASWLFFAGFSLAAGALVVRGLLGSRGRRDAGRPAALVGLLGAAAGAMLALPGVAGRWPPLLLLAVLQLLVVAWALLFATSSWRLPLTVTAAAGALWAVRSHAAAAQSLLGWMIDAVHLVAGGTWLGSLAVVAIVAGRGRGGERAILIHRYARLALVLVLVLAVAGTASAIVLVPTWEALWTSGYGRLVLLKVALLAGAIALAGTSRGWALRTGRTEALRRLMAAEASVLVVALAIAALLANTAPPKPAIASDELLGPPPLVAAATRDAGLAGQLNAEVASDGARLDVVVFGPSGPVPDTKIQVGLVRPDGAELDLVPRPCGRGCFTQEVALRPGDTTVTVRASAPGWTGGQFVARLAWPPGAPGEEHLRGVIERMRQVPRLSMTETVDSGPGSTVTPGRYRGLTGDQLVALEPYAAANVDEVRHFQGPPPKLVLYLSGSQMFIELELDEAGRISRSRLVSRGHDIVRQFSYPDAG